VLWQPAKIPVAEPIRHLYDQDYLDLEQDILLPLLIMQANFWEQFCHSRVFMVGWPMAGPATRKEKRELLPGEKYLLIPTYSPEKPGPKGLQQRYYSQRYYGYLGGAGWPQHGNLPWKKAICPRRI